MLYSKLKFHNMILLFLLSFFKNFFAIFPISKNKVNFNFNLKTYSNFIFPNCFFINFNVYSLLYKQMNSKQQLLKKNFICFELNLQGKSLSLLESLYLELSIVPENSSEPPSETSHYDQIRAIMKLAFKLSSLIN